MEKNESGKRLNVLEVYATWEKNFKLFSVNDIWVSSYFYPASKLEKNWETILHIIGINKRDQ